MLFTRAFWEQVRNTRRAIVVAKVRIPSDSYRSSYLVIVTALVTTIIANEHREGIVIRMLELVSTFWLYKRMDSDYAFLKCGSHTLASPLKLKIGIMRF